MFELLAQSDYNLDYTTTTTPVSSGQAAGLAAFFAVYMLVILVVVVIAIVAMWKIFAKAGKPGWAAIIPIYNIIVLLEVIGRPVWWIIFPLMAFIPFVGWIASVGFAIVVALDLAKSFGKSQTFGIVALFLFSIIGYLMLGFGDAKYVGPAHQQSGGPKPVAPQAPAA